MSVPDQHPQIKVLTLQRDEYLNSNGLLQTRSVSGFERSVMWKVGGGSAASEKAR